MAESSNSMVCPHCHTRLRLAAETDVGSQSCPECGVPLGRSAHEPAPSRTILSGTKPQWLGVAALGVVVVTIVATYWITRIRPTTNRTATSNSVASSNSVDQTTATIETDGAHPSEKADPGTPEPSVAIHTTPFATDEAPLQPPPQVAVVEPMPAPVVNEAKPEAAPRPVIADAAVVPASNPQPTDPPPANKVEMPSRAELISQVLQQRIASIQVAPKTTVRQFARELNEMSNGLLEFDEQISKQTWDKELSLSLKNATMKEVLMAFAQASGLKLDVGLETIALRVPGS